MPGRSPRCSEAKRESAGPRRRDRRCSCTPWPNRIGKPGRQFWGPRTLRASDAGFSFVRSCGVSYYTDAAVPSKFRQASRMDMKAKKSKKNSEPQVAGKPVSASRSEMAEVVLPPQTTPLGKLLAAHVMHLVDIAAAMAAHRHSNSYVGTASVDFIYFRNPASLGAIV